MATPLDEDPFSCFGSDDEDDAADVPFASDAAATDRSRLLAEEANARRTQRRAGNDPSSSGPPLIPIRSPDFEVFDCDAADDSRDRPEAEEAAASKPRRGKGLRALRSYAAGDEILREAAAVRVPNAHAARSREEAEALHADAIREAFLKLPDATRRAVMDLSSSSCVAGRFDDDSDALGPLLGIFRTNSFRLGGPDAADGGLFLTVARINHSCRPNATHFWRPDLQKMVVFAAADIGPGDEICTLYGPSECLDTAGRRAFLRENFSFECACDMCEEGNVRGGDDRMTKLNALQEDVSLLAMSNEPKAAILAVDRCLSLLEEQGIGSAAFIKPILHYGYQISLAGLHDKTMSQTYLAKELVAVNNSEGVGSPNAVEIQQMLSRMESKIK